MCVHVHVCVYVYMSVFVSCLCLYCVLARLLRKFVRGMYVYLRICHICMYVCLYVCVYVFLCICVRVNECVLLRMYVHAFSYNSTHVVNTYL